MKHLLISISLLLISLNCISQIPIDEKTGEVVYTGVIQVEGLSSKELLDKSKFWMVSTLKSGDNMVELSGDNQSNIVGTGNIAVDSIKTYLWIMNSAYLNFKFIVFCKDGRVKYSVENISLNYLVTSDLITTKIDYLKGSTSWKQKWIDEFQENKPKLDKAIRGLIADFKTFITTEQDDDW